MTPDPPTPLRTADVRRTLRDVERLAFVAVRAIDERDGAAVRAAIDSLRERVGRLP